MSSRHQRDKRIRRRQAAPVGPIRQAPLGPHTSKCQCTACETREKKRTARLKDRSAKRLRDYTSGHAHPEHMADWAATAHALAAYMALHDVNKRRRKVTHLELSSAFISHLDHEVGVHDLDAGRLYEALIVMRQVHPLRARIVDSCCAQRRTQDDVGAEEHMSHQAIGQNLEAGLDLLRDIYAGLVLAEQAVASAS